MTFMKPSCIHNYNPEKELFPLSERNNCLVNGAGSDLCSRAYFWPPLIKATLGPVQYRSQDHSGDGKNQYADEDLVSLERCAGNRDHKPNPGSGGVKLSDQNAN